MFPPSGMGNTTQLLVLRDTLFVIQSLRPVVQRLKKCNGSLSDQLERAATSIALNLSEGNAVRDGNRRKHFKIALGSTQETRAALKVAAAWGFMDMADVHGLDRKLDSIAARIYCLAHR